MSTRPLRPTMNDSALVRQIITTAIRQCNKSREQIADEMSALSGASITVRMLNAWTAASKEDERFPSQFERAFCSVTGDNRLLFCRIEIAGFKVISDEQSLLLELGERTLAAKVNAKRISELRAALSGRVA